jgi:hypothetical protein
MTHLSFPKIHTDHALCHINFCDPVKKLSRYRHAGDKGERKYSSYSFLISALDGVCGHTSVGAQYPLYRRLGGPQSCSGHGGYRKNKLLCVPYATRTRLQHKYLTTHLFV